MAFPKGRNLLSFMDFLQVLTLLTLIDDIYAIQLFKSAGSVPSAIPAPCATALTTNITCQQLVPASYISAQRSFSNLTLTDLCTSTCSNSLLDFQTQLDQACGTQSYAFSANINQTVQQIMDPLVWAYNVSCLTDGVSFCLPEVTNTSLPVSPCSDCSLLYGAAMLNSEYGRVRIDPGSFSSVLSSCSVPASSFPCTILPTSSTPTTTAAPTTTCSGTVYTVRPADTCDSISIANNIATDRFLTQNNLDYNCTTLVPGNQVCLGPSCSLYQIQTNDTCNGILANQTFYLTQLLSWNPTIHSSCDNLDSMVGREICISPPGSSTWDVAPQNSTTSWNVTFVVASTNFTTIPPQTSIPVYNTTWFVPTATLNISTSTVTVDPAQISSVIALTVYCPITAEDYSSGWSIYDLPENCTEALLLYCAPTVNATMPPSTSFPPSCLPTYYKSTATTSAVQLSTTSSTMAPEQTGIASNCNAFYTVQSGDTCQGIVDKYTTFTLAQFYSWNPAVGSSCQSLELAYAVCVGVSASTVSTTSSASTTPSSTLSTGVAPSTTVPSPLEPSTDPSCTQYHQVVSGDYCYAIEQTYRITAAQFNQWNPYVGTGCANLWLGYYVCVAAP